MRPLIGVLSPGFPNGPTAIVEDLVAELEARDLVVGRDIELECRYARQGFNTLALAAEELGRLPSDVLVGGRSPEARQCLITRPETAVLVAAAGDPVGFRLAQSLEKPGWNLSGACFLSPELAAARLRLILQAAPETSSIAIVWDDTDFERAYELRMLRLAAGAAGVNLVERPVRKIDEIPGLYGELAGAVEWSCILGGLSVMLAAAQIGEAIADSEVKTVFPQRLFIDYGGELSFEPRMRQGTEFVADFILEILQGADASTMAFRMYTDAEVGRLGGSDEIVTSASVNSSFDGATQ